MPDRILFLRHNFLTFLLKWISFVSFFEEFRSLLCKWNRFILFLRNAILIRIFFVLFTALRRYGITNIKIFFILNFFMFNLYLSLNKFLLNNTKHAFLSVVIRICEYYLFIHWLLRWLVFNLQWLFNVNTVLLYSQFNLLNFFCLLYLFSLVFFFSCREYKRFFKVWCQWAW